MLDTIQSYFTGWWQIKVGKRYVTFAKLAPPFTIAFLTFALGDMLNLLPLFIIGIFLLIFCIFCLFLLQIFPERKHNRLTRVN